MTAPVAFPVVVAPAAPATRVALINAITNIAISKTQNSPELQNKLGRISDGQLEKMLQMLNLDADVTNLMFHDNIDELADMALENKLVSAAEWEPTI